MKWTYKLVFGINVVIVFAMLISCFCAYIDPKSFQYASLAAVTFPFWFVLNLFFILFWIFSYPRKSLLSFVTLLLCMHTINSIVGINKSAASENHSIKVMSYNLSYRFPPKKNTDGSKWMEDQFDKINADIYFFQETVGKKYFKNHFIDYEGFHYQKRSGTAIYSKYKIIDQGKLNFGSKTNSVVWVDLEVENKIIRAYSVHLKSNRITSGEIEKFNDINKDYEQNINETKSVLGKYSKNALQRAEQVKKLLTHINGSPYPVIVAGDFNEPPQSYVYKQMSKNFSDSFKSRGFGVGSTYAGKIPFLRIDYIFLDQNFEIISHQNLSGEWYDHFPVIVEFNI